MVRVAPAYADVHVHADVDRAVGGKAHIAAARAGQAHADVYGPAGGKARIAAALVLLVGVLGCYAHGPSAPSKAPQSRSQARPDLPVVRTGRYVFTGPEGQQGVEQFTVTATGGVWRVRSERVTETGREGFRLDVDLTTAEPVAVEVWRAFDELRWTVRGHREGPWFVLRSDGLGPARAQRLPYAPGTMLDAPSPVFKAAVLALLDDPLTDGRAVTVRTIRIDGSRLTGRVVLSTFERRGVQNGNTLIRLLRGNEGPTGIWARSDGWPVRMRVLVPDPPSAGRSPAWQWLWAPDQRGTTSRRDDATTGRFP